MAFLATETTVVTLTDGLARLADADAPREPMVAVTFDDGTADFAEVALPVLVEHRVPATLYVATDFVEREHRLPRRRRTAHRGPRSRDADERPGWSTSGRTPTPTRCSTGCRADEIDGELDRSIDLIGEHLGRAAPRHFAYPKAVMGSPAADAAVRARFRSAAVAGTRGNRYGATDPYRLARSPIQVSDGMRWFRRKVAGGLGFEDTLRRAAQPPPLRRVHHLKRHAVDDAVDVGVGHRRAAREAQAGAEDLLGHRAAAHLAVGEQRLQVHGLPRRAGLDVERLEVLADRVGDASSASSTVMTVSQFVGSPVGRRRA